MKTVASIILAAGRARRFGAGPGDSKVLAQLEGKALVRHVAEAALNSRAKPVCRDRTGSRSRRGGA